MFRCKHPPVILHPEIWVFSIDLHIRSGPEEGGGFKFVFHGCEPNLKTITGRRALSTPPYETKDALQKKDNCHGRNMLI